MPLRYNKSQKAFDYNIAELIRSGKSKEQAAKIAYDIKRGYKPKRLMSRADSLHKARMRNR